MAQNLQRGVKFKNEIGKQKSGIYIQLETLLYTFAEVTLNKIKAI